MEEEEVTSGKPIAKTPTSALRRQSTLLIIGLLFIWIIFLISQPVAVNGNVQVTADALNKYLEPYRKAGKKPSYSQLQQWFEEHGTPGGNMSISPDLYPRLFPFCVTHEQITNSTLVSNVSKLYNFKNIFEKVKLHHDVTDKFYNFDENIHTIDHNKTFIKEVLMTRINPPEPDMINLRQWAHITIKAGMSLQGIYVQSLVGPIGLPMGDFVLDFACKDNPATSEMLKDGELFDCHFRPRANLYHPKVFVGYNLGGNWEWHVHFQWTDITCMETPYLQFLIIAVKNFHRIPEYGHDYAIVYSPVFLNTEFDSNDGSPYPYHPLWKDHMLCFATDTRTVEDSLKSMTPKLTLPNPEKVNGDSKWAKLKWERSDTIHRIQPNEEYDACIRGTDRKEILELKDLVRMECPPGPFRCTKSYQQTAQSGGGSAFSVTVERQTLVENEKNTSNCYPCRPPPCHELKYSSDVCEGGYTKTKRVQIIQKNDTVIIENLEVVARSKSHGMLAILSTLVLLPIANFMGRHYKEVCRNCLCGNGPWIFVHVVFHFLSAIILWLSVGPVVASISDYDEVLDECSQTYGDPSLRKACAQEKSVRNPHVPTGILVFVMQNLLIIFGFFRSSKNKIRLLQLIAHSHLGYFTFILAAISAFLAAHNKECLEIVLLIGLLFVAPIVLHIISVILDCMTDTKLGIHPRRRQYPVLEPVRLEKRGPCEPCKWCAFAVLFLLMIALWFLVVLSANFSSKKDPDKFDPNIPTGSISTTFSGEEAAFQGIFGVCGYVGGKKPGK